MGLVDAGPLSRIDRYIGDYEPYATSHDALDRDHALFAEVHAAAEAVANGVSMLRVKTLGAPDAKIERVRKK